MKKAIVGLGFPEEEHLHNFLDGQSTMLRLTDDGFRVDLLTKLNINKDFAIAFETAEIVAVPYGKVYFLGYPGLIDEKL